jgi:hypothetical protein
MNIMTIKVELSPEIESRLAAEARAQGLPLETVAEKLLKEALTGRALSHRELSVEEFHQMLGVLAEGSEKLPNLPTDVFSRESFYEDRVNGSDDLSRR